MRIGEVKTLQKTIRSTCDIKEKNTIIFKEDLPVADSNYELHLMVSTFMKDCVYKQFRKE